MSDCYLGLDQQYDIYLNVTKANLSTQVSTEISDAFTDRPLERRDWESWLFSHVDELNYLVSTLAESTSNLKISRRSTVAAVMISSNISHRGLLESAAFCKGFMGFFTCKISKHVTSFLSCICWKWQIWVILLCISQCTVYINAFYSFF